MSSQGHIAIYEAADGQTQIDVRLEGESVWLNRQQMAQLFGCDVKTIGKHVNNVFQDGELARDSTVAKFATVQSEGDRAVERQIEHYNLDVIISVGYRVKSFQGTRFRIWATQRLNDVLLQGYALNEARFDRNAGELQQAIALIQKAARSPELSGDAGLWLADNLSPVFSYVAVARHQFNSRAPIH